MLFDLWLRDGEEQMTRVIGGHKVRLYTGSVYTFDLNYQREAATGSEVPEVRGAGGSAEVTIAGIGWRESKYKKALDPSTITLDRVQSWRAGKLKRILNKVQKVLDDEFGKGHYTQTYNAGERIGKGTGIQYVVDFYKKDKIEEVPPMDPPAPEGIRSFAQVFKGKPLEDVETTTCRAPEGSGRVNCGRLFATVKEMSAHNRTAHNPRKRTKAQSPGYQAPPEGMRLHEEVL